MLHAGSRTPNKKKMLDSVFCGVLSYVKFADITRIVLLFEGPLRIRVSRLYENCRAPMRGGRASVSF